MSINTLASGIIEIKLFNKLIISLLTLQSKPKVIEPLEYETVVVKNKTLLQNDPHREMLLFPPDDVSVSKISYCGQAMVKNVSCVTYV